MRLMQSTILLWVKLDLIIQLPYSVRGELRQQQAWLNTRKNEPRLAVP